MSVLLDTDMLTLLLRPDVIPPRDPGTNAPVLRAAERVQFLIAKLAKDQTRILIPATAWAEFLVAAGESGPLYAAQLKDRSVFEIVPFDAIAAVEAAINQRSALQEGNHKIKFEGSRQCLKADRQIVAIGKTRGVEVIYASDRDIVNIGRSMKVRVVPLWELPLPPEEPSRTPLLDAISEGHALPSIEPAQLSGRSPSAESETTSQPAPDLPSAHPSGQEPQPQGSSDAAPPPVPSKK